jgi:PIN domain nuclease of toxin-antitoxin system
MRLLLDTHLFLSWINGDPRLKPKHRKANSNPANECLLSVASTFEMAIKASLRNLDVGQSLDKFLPEQLAAHRFQALPVSLIHSLRVATLPWHHRDPFDRLLIAQCQVDGLTLLTDDAVLAACDDCLLH